MDKNILQIINEKQYDDLAVLFAHMNAVDISDILEYVEEEQAVEVFRLLDDDEKLSADVFSYLSSERQRLFVEELTDTEVVEIMEDLSVDDIVDLIEDIPDDVGTRVLESISTEKGEIVDRILDYPEDSAGSIMTTEIVELTADTTVKEALHTIRTSGVDKETIYTCYVVDDERKLIGVITADTLLYSKLSDKVENLMETNVIFATASDDREVLATNFSKYDLLAMPVVSRSGNLVGIVTVDDILRVITEEDTEDFTNIVGVSSADVPYMKTGVLGHAKNRIIWLLTLMLTAAVAGAVFSVFEDALEQMAILVAFTPMLMGTGGNAGAQASTVIIRGMALGEIVKTDMLKLVWRETRIAFACSLVLGVVNFGRIVLMHQNFTLAWVVTLCLVITLVVSNMIGCVLPILAKTLKMDPAIMAAPLITAIVDGTALVVFFMVASLAFGL
ncbi:MAG: magnesium transporter [Defluviitaleaceae bacterium]|nr:magnesium transporter [Defluviitaleaceae bacterium]